MEKILFIVCMQGNELAPLKLFHDYPYGQTDVVEWEVIVGNPFATPLNMAFIESDIEKSLSKSNPKNPEETYATYLRKKLKDFDMVVDIHTSRTINPASWDDLALLEKDNRRNKEVLTYVSARSVIYRSNQEALAESILGHHARAIKLEYQKTFDAYADYERILADFERIIHKTACQETIRTSYEEISGEGLKKQISVENISQSTHCEDSYFSQYLGTLMT